MRSGCHLPNPQANFNIPKRELADITSPLRMTQAVGITTHKCSCWKKKLNLEPDSKMWSSSSVFGPHMGGISVAWKLGEKQILGPFPGPTSGSTGPPAESCMGWTSGSECTAITQRC